MAMSGARGVPFFGTGVAGGRRRHAAGTMDDVLVGIALSVLALDGLFLAWVLWCEKNKSTAEGGRRRGYVPV